MQGPAKEGAGGAIALPHFFAKQKKNYAIKNENE